jgi:hypothetical protein
MNIIPMQININTIIAIKNAAVTFAVAFLP